MRDMYLFLLSKFMFLILKSKKNANKKAYFNDDYIESYNDQLKNHPYKYTRFKVSCVKRMDKNSYEIMKYCTLENAHSI